MSKSIKLKNNTFIDTSGISHNRNILKNILDSFDKIKVDVLYDNPIQQYWGGANLGIDISNYDFVILCTKQGSAIVPTIEYLCKGSFNESTWYEPASADRATTRQFWRAGNDIYINNCYGRGINNYSGWGEEPDMFVVNMVYGIKLI